MTIATTTATETTTYTLEVPYSGTISIQVEADKNLTKAEVMELVNRQHLRDADFGDAWNDLKQSWWAADEDSVYATDEEGEEVG